MLTAEPDRPRASRGSWIAILAVALLIRLAFVVVVPKQIQFSDASQFEAIGRLLAEQGTYGHQTLRPPGYPTFIAGVYRVFGEDLRVLRVAEALVSTLAVALLGLVGARWFGRTAGLLTATLTAVHPVLAFLPSTQYSENVAVLMTVAALGASLSAIRQGGLPRWILAGVLFGLAVLVRPNLVLLLPGLALGAAFALHRERRGWLIPFVVTALAMALTLAPWTVRNHREHGRWYFVSTGGGRQFWAGNNPWISGRTTESMQPDSVEQAEFNKLPWNDFVHEQWFYRKGFEFIRAYPGRAARLYFAKLGNLLALYPDTVTRIYINDWSRWAQGLSSVAIYLGTLIGLSRWRREPLLWPLAGASVTFALANAVFFSCMRYRMAFEPCLLLLAGFGWALVWNGLASRRVERAG
jgi:4-amino-4-deoxy-L-arabinose transferase-like glycosyltransferase